MVLDTLIRLDTTTVQQQTRLYWHFASSASGRNWLALCWCNTVLAWLFGELGRSRISIGNLNQLCLQAGLSSATVASALQLIFPTTLKVSWQPPYRETEKLALTGTCVCQIAMFLKLYQSPISYLNVTDPCQDCSTHLAGGLALADCFWATLPIGARR